MESVRRGVRLDLRSSVHRGAAAMFCLMSCTGDFKPYNELLGFRVLAVRAEPPTVPPNGHATMSALTFIGAPETGSDVQYSWSWCPFTTGADLGYTCAVTRDQVQAAVDAVVGQGVLAIPPFELGTTAVVDFPPQSMGKGLPPQFFSGLCQAISMQMLPKFVELPRCDVDFPISIRLEATHGAQTIVAIKTVHMAYTGDVTNANPSISEARLLPKGEVGTPQPITLDETPLTRTKDYQLQLTINPSVSEPYLAPSDPPGGPPVMKSEIISVTWFVQAGDTDKTRTGFIPGESVFEQVDTNVWTTPKKADYEADTVHLAFVIRDNRGGINWLERDVRLGDQ
jgi:hypothetical protein